MNRFIVAIACMLMAFAFGCEKKVQCQTCTVHTVREERINGSYQVVIDETYSQAVCEEDELDYIKDKAGKRQSNLGTSDYIEETTVSCKP